MDLMPYATSSRHACRIAQIGQELRYLLQICTRFHCLIRGQRTGGSRPHCTDTLAGLELPWPNMA
ncbi:hypothetical protein DPMN_052342 [Dreissena polymorpha]|uniref:Uncharacterized protein n=1 Tax=Dreissena polymorpha TaxID=45954 RepID=A0A9D4HPS9_DREPO|nr:hypothetical protein DPMN_052342 [Dreissena polymorpha]